MLKRSELRARVLPLDEEGRQDPTAFATAEERLAVVGDLTREMWALAGWEIPTYSRAEIPVLVRLLGENE